MNQQSEWCKSVRLGYHTFAAILIATFVWPLHAAELSLSTLKERTPRPLESGDETALDYQYMPLSIAMARTTTVKTKPQKMALSDSPSARASAPRDIFR